MPGFISGSTTTINKTASKIISEQFSLPIRITFHFHPNFKLVCNFVVMHTGSCGGISKRIFTILSAARFVIYMFHAFAHVIANNLDSDANHTNLTNSLWRILQLYEPQAQQNYHRTFTALFDNEIINWFRLSMVRLGTIHLSGTYLQLDDKAHSFSSVTHHA